MRYVSRFLKKDEIGNIIRNGYNIEIVTMGKFEIIVKFVHFIKKKRVKRYLKYLYKYNRR